MPARPLLRALRSNSWIGRSRSLWGLPHRLLAESSSPRRRAFQATFRSLTRHGLTDYARTMTESSPIHAIRAQIASARASLSALTEGPPGFRLLPPDPGVSRLAGAVQELASAMDELTDIVEAMTERPA